MSIAIPKWLIPWLAGAGATSILLTLILAIRAYVHLRRAEYYIVRESARQTLVRALLVIPILALLTVAVLFVPRQTPAPAPTSTPTPTASDLSPTVTPTLIPPTATATTTPQPTATEPFIPTSTPQATLPATFASPLPSAVPPPADARIDFWTFAEGVSEDNQPTNPAREFSTGIERIYLFFRYDGLLPNVPLTILWYRNGEYLAGGTDLWESQKPAGERYTFLSQGDGYAVGEYEAQIWLGERLQVRTFFSVVEKAE